jgi:murein DD-endopeptidase MepM/ murein hydrolase activator NlpD
MAGRIEAWTIVRLSRRLSVLVLLLAGLSLAACNGGDDVEVRVIVDGTVLPSPTVTTTPALSTPAPLPFTPTPPASNLDPEDLYDFVWPLEGACLPDSDRLMPNSPREYRNGFHEGVDWYDLSSCARIAEGTQVLAMYRGVVIRAGLDYVDLTPRVLADLEERTDACECTDAEVFDVYRGRQIWIDHGNGVVTRYAHLGSIADGVYEGADIERGQVIAGVGESGTPESVTDPGTEMHLHAEVRIGESFLGDGLPPDEVRALWERLFVPAE